MEKADIKKKIHLALVALIFYIQKGTAFSTSPSALTSCASSTANISFTLIFDAGESIIGKRIWRFSGGKIAESDGTTLTPEPSYSSRLIAYGTSGISLSNITDADAGAYTYVILISPAIRAYTATTSLSVQVAPPAPPSGCQVSATQSSNILTCAVNTNSGYCGTPSLNAFWVYSTNTSNQIICNVTETYQCCATSAALTCYNGSSNDFCKLFNCTDVTNKTNKQCQPSESQLVLGLGLGLGLGIQCVFIIIVVVIFKCTGKNHEDNPQETDGTKPEQVPLEPTEVSSVQTCVGSEAKFSFKLTEDSNESAVLIKNKSYGVVMTARGKEGSSDDPFYKDRVNFTGNTYQKLISFILRKVTLSDAGIYIAVHSDPNLIIGCQALIVKGCKRARNLGLVLGLGLGIIFIVCCIIIASLILTGTTPCKNELGLGLGLGSGMPCVITIIIAVIFTFCSFPLFKGIPNIHDFGEGILDGFVIGIIVKRLKSHEQVPLEPTEVSSVQTCVGSEAHFNFMLTEDCNESAVHIKNKSGGVLMIARGKEGKSGDPVYKDRVNFTGNTDQKLISFILRNVTLSDAGIYIAVHSDPNIIIGCQVLIVKDTKGMTKNPGSSSAVSREQVQVQLEIKGFKDDEEERPPAVHTRTQNKVDPSKQTNDRQQPVPPAYTGFEDNPTFRPQPPPPQKGEIKDRNVRGISATIGDTPDLASETPRPKKLPPLPLKQETVQEENVSEEPKKKKKKKKKKDQMNVETPEEENGETDMRLN